jgi:tRNA dimethylallyltransferase
MNAAAVDDAFILTGPTASGKSALGVELAEQLNAEIISMDSMALYRGMNIGTAKPSSDERNRVPHHLIDVLDPWESGSVAWWLKEADRCAKEIKQRRRKVLFVGGTPLYLKALLHGLFDGPAADLVIRQRLTAEAERHGRDWLYEKLRRVDPITAGRVHRNDLKKIIRALEVWETTGRAISSWQGQWQARAEHSSQPGPLGENPGKMTRVLWLNLPRPVLYTRIDERVKQMFAAGMVGEVEALLSLPEHLGREARQALGYKEVIDYIDGRRSLDETVRKVQTRSRNFAKRQITWFRHLPECRPVTRELTFLAWGLTMKV